VRVAPAHCRYLSCGACLGSDVYYCERSSEAAGKPCPMPSAAGKRVERVLAGCSKPEAEDKPGLHYLARDTRSSRYHCIGQHDVVKHMSGFGVTKNIHVGIQVHLEHLNSIKNH